MHKLSNPSFFDFTDHKGGPCRGANQEWYGDPWQRRAGCGPTTAATLLSYLAAAHPALAPLAPEGLGHDAAAFRPYMEAVWKNVTPTMRGLNSLALFTDGSLAFARERGVPIETHALAIPGKNEAIRPSLEDCRRFMEKALSKDCPLAFLNFSNGALTNLDSWHWVPLIAAWEEGESLRCAILDDGKEKVIDFSLWYLSSKLGGGLVTLTP